MDVIALSSKNCTKITPVRCCTGWVSPGYFRTVTKRSHLSFTCRLFSRIKGRKMRTSGPADLLYLRPVAFPKINAISVTKEYVTLKEQRLQCLYLQPVLLPMTIYNKLIISWGLSEEAHDGLKPQTDSRTASVNGVYSKSLMSFNVSFRNVEELRTVIVTTNFRSLPTTSSVNAFSSIRRNDRFEQNIFVRMSKQGLNISEEPEFNFAVPRPERRGRMDTDEREITQAYQRDDYAYEMAMQKPAPAISYSMATVLPVTRIIKTQSRGHKVEEDPANYTGMPRIFKSLPRTKEEHEGKLRGNLIHRNSRGISEADITKNPKKPAPQEEAGKVTFGRPDFPSGNTVSSEGNVKVEVLADRVYDLLERKIRIEKERRGM